MFPQDRRGVLWITNGDPIAIPFEERRLGVKKVRLEDLAGNLDSARCLILVVERGKLDLLRDQVQASAGIALDRGVIVVALLQTDLDFDPADKMLQAIPLGSRVRLEFEANIKDVAETVARATQEIGPSCGGVDLPVDLGSISSESRLLLTRAFHDCKVIQAEPIDGGFVAECTLRVHAWLAASLVGPRPMPFFVKAGSINDIGREVGNYERVAGLYIPFNLRPNLIPDRCVVGSDRALLVGNFVEDAIPLRKALQSGQGSTAIFSLFENTLGGFRMQPFTHGASASAGLDFFVKERCWAETVRPDIVELAITLGLRRQPVALQGDLMVGAKDLKCRWGPYHGDLHAGNVMIRHRDAIVIDLASVGTGPLTADPATLEVSLVFDSIPPKNTFGEWKDFVDQLFGSLPSLSPPTPEAKPTNFSWLYRAVRELRHVLIGLEGIEKEALIILATYLIRFARLIQKPVSIPPTFSEQRHAYALVIAERLLEASLSAI